MIFVRTGKLILKFINLENQNWHVANQNTFIADTIQKFIGKIKISKMFQKFHMKTLVDANISSLNLQ